MSAAISILQVFCRCSKLASVAWLHGGKGGGGEKAKSRESREDSSLRENSSILGDKELASKRKRREQKRRKKKLEEGQSEIHIIIRVQTAEELCQEDRNMLKETRAENPSANQLKQSSRRYAHADHNAIADTEHRIKLKRRPYVADFS